MNNAKHRALRSWPAAVAGACLALSVAAETPGELNKPGTYQGSTKNQQQYDQQQQQNRDQQQQQQQQSDQQWNDTLKQQQAQQNAAIAQGQDVLRTWQKRPPLAAERNPLLGRWTSQGTGGKQATGGNDMAALASALLGGITGGMCDSMLGKGPIEFRPTAVVAIGPNGREQVKYHADYRGGGSRVVVLPKEPVGFTHMIIDLAADRATVAAVGCVLVRAGAAPMQNVASVASVATDWHSTCSMNNGATDIYVAASTIRKSGDLVRMQDMFAFKSPQVIAGSRVQSVRNEYEYDCRKMRRRMLSTVGFSGPMGKGSVVVEDHAGLAWESVPQGSTLQTCYLKTACAKP